MHVRWKRRRQRQRAVAGPAPSDGTITPAITALLLLLQSRLRPPRLAGIYRPYRRSLLRSLLQSLGAGSAAASARVSCRSCLPTSLAAPYVFPIGCTGLEPAQDEPDGSRPRLPRLRRCVCWREREGAGLERLGAGGLRSARSAASMQWTMLAGWAMLGGTRDGSWTA